MGDDVVVSYAALAERIRAWEVGGTVAVQAPNSSRWAEAALGAMAAGGRVTGVSPLATDRERSVQLEGAGATTLVTANEVLQLAGDPVPAGEDVAFLPYSSGTTGLPKGVMLTHANLVASVRQLSRLLRIRERDVVLAVAPFSHVMGFVVTCALPLTAGATVVTMPRFDFEALLATVERRRSTPTANAPSPRGSPTRPSARATA